MIVTGSDGGEVQFEALRTVNVYVPAEMPVSILVVPVPVVFTLSGIRVIVHEPDAGSPLNATLPVDNVHVGCVTVPITGVVGVTGWAFTTAFAEEADVHPRLLVTVKV